MIRGLIRYRLLFVTPLLAVVFLIGCQSSGRHGRVDPCSGCGRSHQSADPGHGQANDGHDHAHP